MRLFVSTLFLGTVACSNGSSNGDAGNDGSVVSDTGSDVVLTDGPASDGNNTDAGGGCGPYKYCEDFESYTPGTIANAEKLGPWVATVNGMGIVMQIDTTHPYKSSQALHVSSPSNAGMDAGTAVRGTLNQMATGGLIPGNNMYGRAMVYYSNTGGNDLPLKVHSWLFNSGGVSSVADGGVTMNMGGGGAMMQLNYHPPAPLTEQSVVGGTMTAGAWHCVQWEYDGSGSPVADVGKVWVDGNLAVNVAATKGWNFATPWDTFDFGFTHYQALANSVDVFLDDFALDGSMVPVPALNAT